MPEKEGINRLVRFVSAPAMDYEDKTGINNRWIYIRAPEGYLFQLIEAYVSSTLESSLTRGIVAFYDGHEYTHWNQFPGVESRELIGRGEVDAQQHNIILNFHGWECKEYTIGARSTTETYGMKVCVIIWFYLKKATRFELLEYALKHPIREDTFKRALRGTTVEPTEVET